MKQAGEIWGHCWEKPDRHHWTLRVNKGFVTEPKVPVDPKPHVSGVDLSSMTMEPLVCLWVSLICSWLDVFPTSFVLQQLPEWSDGSRMRFGEVMNKVMSPMEISFCSIFILLFGVAWSYRSVKWGRSQERKFGSCCFRVWVEINYLCASESCTSF